MTDAPRITGIYGILPADIALRELLSRAEAALAGGIKTLQLRDKKQEYKKAIKRACALRVLTHEYGARMMINDSMQLAVESGADGVHLGRGDVKGLIRPRSEPDKPLMIGISCKGDIAFARHVLNEGADYVSLGSVFPTSSKGNAVPIGLPRLYRAREMLPEANICAIGGIGLESLSMVKRAGADCAAVISALFSSRDIELTARQMIETWLKA